MHGAQWRLLASYNQWMNEKVYEAASRLTPDELKLDRKAFFGSILGTLNHIAVGDTIWLRRFKVHLAHSVELDQLDRIPVPERLDQMLFDELDALGAYRRQLDQLIATWVESISTDDLASVMRYRNMKGVESARRFDMLLLHFFNHQTHHRGQVIDLLYQAGVDVGVTDLLAVIPQAE